ncbi:MAG: TetR/AcrR family transcriptional regulator [Angustibacter sp.]
MPTSPARRADAVANRRAVLDAALEVLSTSPEASLGEIATRAGVSRRTLYGHFASREDLLAELAREVGRGASERLAAVPASGGPLEALAVFVHATSALVASHHRLADLSRAPGVREQVSGATEAVRARLRELVVGADGQLDLRGAGPDAVVRLVRAMQWGLVDAVSQGEIAEEQAPVVATRSVVRALGVDHDQVEQLVAAL